MRDQKVHDLKMQITYIHDDDQRCKQDQILKTKTKTTGCKQRHLADLYFK